MKGKMTDMTNQVSVNFDFEPSETPKEIFLNLLNSQPENTMLAFCNGKPGYDEIKGSGDFDIAQSSIAINAGTEMVPLAWDQPLQAQASEQIKALQAKGKEVPFVATVTKVVG